VTPRHSAECATAGGGFFMTKFTIRIKGLFSLIILLALTGCIERSSDIASVEKCPAPSQKTELINLSLAKERIEAYYECGQYDRDMDAIVNQVISHFSKISPENNAAVVFDIDDTVLSSYCDEKSISFGYIPEFAHEWVMRADAPAIAQSKKLYDYLVKHGFHVIFLTGRKLDEYDATLKNLREQGFSTFDKLIVRSPAEEQLSAQEYKTAHRSQLTKEGYHIVGSVGDQWSDLEGGNVGYKVKLPNYRYLLR